MTIKVGDKIPAIQLSRMGQKGPEQIDILQLISDKKVVIFSVPGAFTPTCSNIHLPDFIQNTHALKLKGIDLIICVAVNDIFVMDAWGTKNHVDDNIIMLSDGNAEFTSALGLTSDLSIYGMGLRSKRYAMVVNSGVIMHLAVESQSGVNVSGAEHILTYLENK